VCFSVKLNENEMKKRKMKKMKNEITLSYLISVYVYFISNFINLI